MADAKEILDRAQALAALVRQDTGHGVSVTQIPSHVVIHISKSKEPEAPPAQSAEGRGNGTRSLADPESADDVRAFLAHVALHSRSVSHVPQATRMAQHAILEYAEGNPGSTIRVLVPTAEYRWFFVEEAGRTAEAGKHALGSLGVVRPTPNGTELCDADHIVLDNGAKIAVSDVDGAIGAMDEAGRPVWNLEHPLHCDMLVIVDLHKVPADRADSLWGALNPHGPNAPERIAVIGGGWIPHEDHEHRDHGYFKLLFNDESSFRTFIWDWELYGVDPGNPSGTASRTEQEPQAAPGEVQYGKMREHARDNRFSVFHIDRNDEGMMACLILEEAAKSLPGPDARGISIMIAAPDLRTGAEVIGKIKEMNELHSFFGSSRAALDVTAADDMRVRFANRSKASAVAITEDAPDPFEGMDLDVIAIPHFERAPEEAARAFMESLRLRLELGDHRTGRIMAFTAADSEDADGAVIGREMEKEFPNGIRFAPFGKV